ncbi:MAG TPA: PQQ-dependent sugar dehydrogenase [Acidimicrobiia bacterium]|nr:PQQ-dependent sugar dehydrogenase [Acidimicrobiia bacterium]
MSRSLRSAALAAIVLTLAIPAPHAHAATITAQAVATGLAFPAAFTVFPGGDRLLYGERFTGEVHVYNIATGTDTHIFTIPGVAGGTGEQGLLGLAFHPNYPTTARIYAYATRPNASGGRENQIVRFTWNGGTGSNLGIIFRSSAAQNHNGGRILFGPDGHLYATSGDRGDPANSQDLTSKAGKVLRMTQNGGIPADNPISGRHWFAYGVRNSFGMAFDPQGGRLWKTDNGPTCNDEVNRVDKGRNYGWGPSWTCSTPPQPPVNTNQDGPNVQMPARWFGTSVAPTGIAFCSSCDLGAESEGDLFWGEFNTGRVRRGQLGPQRAGITGQSIVYDHPGRILAMERARDGTLFISDPDGIHRLAFV